MTQWIMENFLLLIREDVRLQRKASVEQFSASIHAMTRWVEDLALSGNFISGEPLHTYGHYVTKDFVMSDGPFIEAKEAVSGYVLIRAENLDQAGGIAQNCPEVLKGRLAIEVRPIIGVVL